MYSLDDQTKDFTWKKKWIGKFLVTCNLIFMKPWNNVYEFNIDDGISNYNSDYIFELKVVSGVELCTTIFGIMFTWLA